MKSEQLHSSGVMLLLEDMAMDYYVAAVLQKASFKVVIQTEHTVEDSMVDLNTFM